MQEQPDPLRMHLCCGGLSTGYAPGSDVYSSKGHQDGDWPAGGRRGRRLHKASLLATARTLTSSRFIEQLSRCQVKSDSDRHQHKWVVWAFCLRTAQCRGKERLFCLLVEHEEHTYRLIIFLVVVHFTILLRKKPFWQLLNV